MNIKLFNKFLKLESGSGKTTTKIAWEFFILLVTSVLSNESKGKVSEAVDSILNIFKESKRLLLNFENSNLVADIILKIINLKIRPILTYSRTLTVVDKDGKYIILMKN